MDPEVKLRLGSGALYRLSEHHGEMIYLEYMLLGAHQMLTSGDFLPSIIETESSIRSKDEKHLYFHPPV